MSSVLNRIVLLSVYMRVLVYFVVMATGEASTLLY